MADIQSGNTPNLGGIHGAARSAEFDADSKTLSIADLSTLVMMERSDILDKQIRDQIGMVKSKNEKMKMLGQIQSKMTNQKSHTQAVNKNTWSVNSDKDPKEIALDNGYKIQIHGKNESWSIVDSNGNNTKIWGDPHVNEGDKSGSVNWDFLSDSTFVLDDGTKITCKCKTTESGGIYSDELVITKANQSIHVTGLTANKPQIGEPNLNGAALDAQTNDGSVFKMGDQADDWVFNGKEITGGYVNGKKAVINEDNSMKSTNDNINQLLTNEEQNLLKELGITFYDASGIGLLTPEEINNINTQIKSSKDTLTSISQLDMVKLQSLTGKYEQTNSLASQVMKQMYSQSKEIIRNI